MWNNLTRGDRYVFVFVNEISCVIGVLHEIAPDGTLIVGADGETYRLNPSTIVYVRST